MSPAPTVTFRMGGAAASPSSAAASAETWGHWESSAFPEASCMANAMQVGKPQSLQFVFGKSLKICNPLNAKVSLLSESVEGSRTEGSRGRLRAVPLPTIRLEHRVHLERRVTHLGQIG